jgi:LemA protein
LFVVVGGGLLLLVLAMFVVGIYNRLVALRNRFKNAFAQIDVQLKRRNDLIPNLVETVKGYMAHEKGTLEAVIEARNAAVTAGKSAAASPGDASAMTGLAAAEGTLNGALGRLFALAEAYPDLKANQNMLALQEELGSTENKIAFSRQAYNDAVMQYNTSRETFPNVIVANFLNFAEAKLFEVESEKERQTPQVSFS